MRAVADLALLSAVTVVSLIVLATGQSGSALSVLVGTPLLLVIPGYAILSAAFPMAGPSAGHLNPAGDNDSPWRPSIVEWWTLTIAISLLTVPIVAIILIASPIQFGRIAVIVSLGLVCAVTLTIAAVRRLRFSLPRQTDSDHESYAARITGLFGTNSASDFVLSVALVSAIVLLIVSGAYAFDADHGDSTYTELYLVTENESGEYVASGYPESVEAGESLLISAAVGNHEDRSMEYSLVIQEQRVVDEEVVERTELQRIDYQLSDGETGYGDHSITPERNEGTVRIAYLLFPTDTSDVPDIPTENDAYRYAYFWTEVIPPNDGPTGEVSDDDDED